MSDLNSNNEDLSTGSAKIDEFFFVACKASNCDKIFVLDILECAMSLIFMLHIKIHFIQCRLSSCQSFAVFESFMDTTMAIFYRILTIRHSFITQLSDWTWTTVPIKVNHDRQTTYTTKSCQTICRLFCLFVSDFILNYSQVATLLHAGLHYSILLM